MKIGYQLEGVAEQTVDREGKIPTYRYRKDLRIESPRADWVAAARAGKLRPLSEVGNDLRPTSVLVDPLDAASVQSLVDGGYRGVTLLRPEDFGDEHVIERPAIVFTKKAEAEFVRPETL